MIDTSEFESATVGAGCKLVLRVPIDQPNCVIRYVMYCCLHYCDFCLIFYLLTLANLFINSLIFFVMHSLSFHVMIVLQVGVYDGR